MRVMTPHATLGTGSNPAMAFGQSHPIHRVTGTADSSIGLLGGAELWRVNIMAGVALPRDGRGMTNPGLPVLIDIVTAQAEIRLRFDQEAVFIVAMGVMADRTVLMPPRRPRRRLTVTVTAHTEFTRVLRQQKRQAAAV